MSDIIEDINTYFSAVKWLEDNKEFAKLPPHYRPKEYWNNIDIKQDGRKRMDYWLKELIKDR